MGKIRLIIGREYLSRVKKKSFILMTILGPILFVGMYVLAFVAGQKESIDHKVIVIDPDEFLPLKLDDNPSLGIQFFWTRQEISDEEFLESNYTDLIQINEKTVQNKTFQALYKSKPDESYRRYVSNEIERSLLNYFMERDSLDPIAYRNAQSKSSIDWQWKDIYSDQDANEETFKAVVGFVFSIFIFMFVLMYGMYVLRGVIEEKTSRVVEVLASSVKPFQLMMGKIIGIMMVAITQFAIWNVLTLLLIAVLTSTIPEMGANNLDNTQYSVELQEELPQGQDAESLAENSMVDYVSRINWPVMIGSFFFYFIGGYLLYAAMFAAVGSAVDSEAETQQFMLPVMLPLIFSYASAVAVIDNPDGTLAVTLSHIPFTSPVVMLVRIGTGTVAFWEVIVSMTTLVFSFVGMTWLASRIYRTGILMYGKKPSWKEMWKWLRYH